MTVGSLDPFKTILEAYSPQVFEYLQYRYAMTVLSESDLENLEWALKFINDYERKHK